MSTPMYDGESIFPLPVYSITDDNDFTSRIEQTPTTNFPILESPQFYVHTTESRHIGSDKEWDSYLQVYHLELDIVRSFFSAIEAGHDDVVADFISRGWVSPDIPNNTGETPLIAAVRAGKTPMVSRLVALGAAVNAFGAVKCQGETFSRAPEYSKRTPLMVAAEHGHLALVRVLMDDYGADDSLIAPDGAMALRLAAINGHREIVAFLPTRRGGALLRWKTAHRKEMERVKRAYKRLLRFATYLLWKVPKFFVYDIPKGVARGIWNRRQKMADWCKKAIKELPTNIKKGALALPRNIKRASKAAWRCIKKIPPFLKRVAVAIWKLIQSIPGAVKILFNWLGQGLKSIGEAIANVALRLFSLLHTVFMAVVTFFQWLTFKDIWDGFCYLLHAMFVDAPKAIAAFIVAFGQTAYDILKALFGTLGKCIWYIIAGILWLIQYIPRRIWQIIEALGRSAVEGYREVVAFTNPKHM